MRPQWAGEIKARLNSAHMNLRSCLRLGFLFPSLLLGDDIQFFEAKVRPLLASQCYGCHSSKSKIVQGGLRLDSREGMVRGGHLGPAVVPGKPDESRIVQAVRHQVEPTMPPWGKLKPEQIGILEEWVRRGAPWPQDAPERAGGASEPSSKTDARNHWAWQPVRAVQPPAVKKSDWPRDAIDRFLLQKLEQKGLQPAPPADAAVLLRRVYFDLTGLPPTPEVIERFLRDPSDQQFEQIVDELLASPDYAERWGRWWLDVTYYGDTFDPGTEIPATAAWRYRDYVIKSFGNDKPLNRFIQEQIAGDLLPATSDEQRRELTIATGYLAIGPWAIVLADKTQLKMDVVDQQLDGIGRGILGLTLGCARCHDHKFDPLSLQDYYGLAGILSSTRTLHGKYKPDGVFSDINKVPLWESAEERQHREKQLGVYESEIGFLNDALKSLEKEKADLAKTDIEREQKVKDLDARIQSLKLRISMLEFNKPLAPYAYAVQDEPAPGNCRINIRGNAHQLGKEVPRSFVKSASFGDAPSEWNGSGRLELARWLSDDRNPLTARVYVNRVWQQMFGSGIVRSPENFGIRGELPSHPELLDYLAKEFMSRHGWSTKSFLRRLVLTSAYRMSSAAAASAQSGDPENHLFSRANRRRLEAETIRDSILVISGRYDPTRGGPALPTETLETFSPNLTTFNPPGINPDARLPERLRYRRTVYLPVFRGAQMEELDILNLFDFADSTQVNAARRQTIVPTQSLFLLNSPWINEQAQALASKLLGDNRLLDRDRVARLITLVYNRPAKSAEIEQALRFIYEFELRLARERKSKRTGSLDSEAWTAYIQTLFASNEFLYRS